MWNYKTMSRFIQYIKKMLNISTIILILILIILSPNTSLKMRDLLSPSTFFKNDFEKTVNLNLKQARKLGYGGQGTVYLHPNDPKKVIKIFNILRKNALSFEHLKIFKDTYHKLKNSAELKNHLIDMEFVSVELDNGKKIPGIVMPLDRTLGAYVADLDTVIYNPESLWMEDDPKIWGHLQDKAFSIIKKIESLGIIADRKAKGYANTDESFDNFFVISPVPWPQISADNIHEVKIVMFDPINIRHLFLELEKKKNITQYPSIKIALSKSA
ncbi:hypothetical protein ACFLQ1_01800 [Candidatus Auribacterota bacterium]